MKYFGGKNKLGKELAAIINEHIDENTVYVEPFLGSGGLLPYINKPKYMILNDKHPYLIDMGKQLQDGGFPSDEGDPTTEEYYSEGEKIHKELKQGKDLSKYDKYDGKWSRGFVSYFGIQVCFAGDGYCGFSRRNGKYNFFKSGYKGTKIKQKVIQNNNVTFFNIDYKLLLDDCCENYVIYLDPPYLDTSGYPSGKIDHDEFGNLCRKLGKNNKIFISEQKAPDDFKIVGEKSITRGMTGKDGQNIKAVERLFTI